MNLTTFRYNSSQKEGKQHHLLYFYNLFFIAIVGIFVQKNMMRLYAFILVVGLFTFNNSTFGECCWEKQSNFTQSRVGNPLGISINGKAYVGGGVSGGQQKKDWWEFDPATNTWTQMADLGGGKRSSMIGFSYQGIGYAGLGWDGSTSQKDLWAFNPSTNNWTNKTDFPGSARKNAKSFVIDSFAYAGTGDDGTVKKDFYKYNIITDNWDTISSFVGTARATATAFSIDSFGYLGLGNDGAVTKDFYRYNPYNDTWAQIANFGGVARLQAEGISIDKKGYVGVGIDAPGGNELQDFWRYDPSANSWTQICNFGGSTRAQGISLAIDYNKDGINDRGFVGLGRNSTTGDYQDFWQLTIHSPKSDFSYFEDSLYTISFSDSSQHTDSITWLFGDGTISTDTTPTHFFSDTLDTVTTCLIATNPCASDTTCKTIPLCPPKTTAKFFYQTEGLDVHFIDSSQNATSWQWSFGDGDFNMFQNPTHSYSKEGTYEVCLYASNKCHTDTLCDSITVKSTKVEPANNNSKIKVYPNPVQDHIYFTTSEKSKIKSIELFSIQGQQVPVQIIKLTADSWKVSFNQSNPAAIYFLKIYTASTTYTRKVVCKND